ncbi:MAG: M20/M25/M40 family metallo-hydrolase [Candidatus Atribacteria bacterium]|nr:M20/M25/M40 family metallo-hydrolase [Candidatus Atribacteria bacterium]
MLNNNNRLVSEFIELVKIDSISKNEAKIAKLLLKRLRDLGLEVIIDETAKEIGGDTGNIIARLKGDVKRFCPVVFVAHMDTVTPGNNVHPQIKEDGRIVSDGKTILGADDKAGIAALLEALRFIKENNIPHGDIEIIFTTCEEIGLLGSKSLDISRLKSKMAFVLDAIGRTGKIITSAPSLRNFKIVIRGKAAHAGANPENGINAIKIGGDFLSQISLGRIDEETTANIGIISGGKATNIIPDKVVLKGEVRSRDNEKIEDYIDKLQETLENLAKKTNAITEIEIKKNFDGYKLSSTSPIVKVAIKAAESIGLRPELCSGGGGTDANIFNEKGILSINLAVGMMNVHTIGEWIYIEDLERIKKYIIAIVENFNRNLM